MLLFSFCLNQNICLGQTDTLENPHIKINKLYNYALANKFSYPNIAIASLNEAIALFNVNQPVKSYGMVYKELGYLYVFVGNYKLAEENLNNGVKLAQSINDEVVVADCQMGLGNIYYTNGNLALAVNYYLNALKVYEKYKDNTGLNNVYTALSDLYYRQNNFTKAIEYNLKAVKIFEGRKDKLRQVVSYESLGNLFYKQNKLKEAESYFLKALSLFKEMGNNAGQSLTLQNLGDIKYQQNKDIEAIFYYTQSKAIAAKFNAKPLLVQNLIDLGRCYYEIEDYDNAQISYKNAIEIAKANNMNLELNEAYEGISLLYKAINDKRKSSAFLALSNNLKDAVYNDSTLKQIADLQLRYEDEKKQSQIELLKKSEELHQLDLAKEKEIKNYLYIVSVLLLLLVAGFIYFNFKNKKITSELREKYTELKLTNNKVNQQKEELTQLNNVKDRFFSIISHDLRNNLSTMRLYFDYISNKNYTSGDEKQITRQIAESVENTIDLLENLLVWASNQIKGVPLVTEKLNLYDLTEENINLLNANAANKDIILRNEMDSDITAIGDKNTVNLILRNLISNAIKFTPNGGEVTIINDSEEEFIKVMVIDNGVGISAKKLPNLFIQHVSASTKGTANEKGTGLGLMLCKEFVEKNGGEIWVESEEGNGSCFTFTLPIA